MIEHPHNSKLPFYPRSTFNPNSFDANQCLIDNFFSKNPDEQFVELGCSCPKHKNDIPIGLKKEKMAEVKS